MAHAVLLGKTDMVYVAFQVADQVEHSENSLSLEVLTYSHDILAYFVNLANNVIPQIETALGIEAERARVKDGILEPTAGIIKPKRNRRRK